MMVVVDQITKKFGKVKALDEASIEIPEGEIRGFIGPNGAGKTTMLRVLMGIIKANSGEAKIFGKDVWKDAVEIHQRIAFVPGDVNLWPNLTGGEVIDLFLRLRKKKASKFKEELIEAFDLDPTKKCRTYSKGNRQKVALISAFASESDLYLFDEPTSGLDPLMELVFQQYVYKVKREGKSVLLSSHILSEVEKLCDVVSIIREGRIIETGTLSELRHLTRTMITVGTQRPVEGLERFPDIHDYKEVPVGISFTTNTENVGEIVEFLMPFGIINLEAMPPTLEELFMSHYKKED